MFGFSVGVKDFVLGLGQISSFFLFSCLQLLTIFCTTDVLMVIILLVNECCSLGTKVKIIIPYKCVTLFTNFEAVAKRSLVQKPRLYIL